MSEEKLWWNNCENKSRYLYINIENPIFCSITAFAYFPFLQYFANGQMEMYLSVLEGFEARNTYALVFSSIPQNVGNCSCKKGTTEINYLIWSTF